MRTNGPLEGKVTAASTAAALAGALVWLLQEHVFGGAVPEPIQVLVYLAVPGLCALVAGWAARHTWRSDAKALAARPRSLPSVPPPADYGG